MTRGGRRALLACALLLPIIGSASSTTQQRFGNGCARPAEVVVTDAEGSIVASAGLPGNRRFALTYRHSVYGAPASEWFIASCDGRLRLTDVSSASEAVLDYYALEGSRTRTGARWRLQPSAPAIFDELPLVATALGRRTLEVDGDRLPLWRDDGEPQRLRLRVVALSG